MVINKVQRSIALLVLALLVMTMGIGVQAQETAPLNSVSFNGISFNYSAELGASVNIWNFAGDPTTLDQQGGPQPPQTAFYLYDSAVPTENNFGTGAARASVTVYDLGRFGGYDFSQNQVSALHDLLSARPDLSAYEHVSASDMGAGSSLPFLPIYPAARVIHARTNYVQTTALAGISYITVFRQDVSPFTADEFIYTIQAITNDNRYYVSAIEHLNIASFPAALDTVNLEAFMATLDQYFADSIAQINNAAEGDITPSTTLLDDVVNSLTISAAIQPAQPTQAAPGGSESGSNALTGTWTLVRYGAVGAETPALPNTDTAITFSATGVSGNVGCNSFSGSYTFDNAAITFSQVVSTMMACDGAIMTQETTVLNGLNNATSFSVGGDTLGINYTNDDGTTGVLLFTREQEVIVVPNTDPTLRGLSGSWNLVSYGAADVQTPTLPDTPALITFSEAGINGNAGCNNFSGSFTFDNDQLSIGVLASTRMACAEPVMAQENAVLNALGGAIHFSIDGDTLHIQYTNPDGTTGVLTFSRAV